MEIRACLTDGQTDVQTDRMTNGHTFRSLLRPRPAPMQRGKRHLWVRKERLPPPRRLSFGVRLSVWLPATSRKNY